MSEDARKRYTISIAENADFDSCVSTMLTTTNMLGAAINEFLKAGFEDYVGCTLVPTPIDSVANGRNILIPYLYFKLLNISKEEYNDPNRHFAFKPSNIEKTNENIVEKVQRMNSMGLKNVTTRVTSITQDAKDALWPIMARNNRDFKWEANYTAKPIDNQTYIMLKSADLIKLLEEIYGKYDEEGSAYEYSVSIHNPVGGATGVFGMQYNMTQYGTAPLNYVIQIMRAHKKAVDRAAQRAGIMYASDIPIIMAH